MMKYCLKKLDRYIGYKIKEEKIIYINYYMNSPFFIFYNKYKDLVTVDDGGDNYFEINVNISTGEVFDFNVNGES